MAREIVEAVDAAGGRQRFLLEVFAEGEHWTSTLTPLAADGRERTERVAPRFYGSTAEQARRRMLSTLEDRFEEVNAVGET
ncbi:MAG: hypothetical protein IPM64_12260 [Phycisphaerales bacterium]|nr:hypothetical protein [Phycisphaerales bacterium]